MIVRDRDRIKRFKSMLRAAVHHHGAAAVQKPPVQLPGLPGMAEVWAHGAKVYVFPSSGGMFVWGWLRFSLTFGRRECKAKDCTREPSTAEGLCVYCQRVRDRAAFESEQSRNLVRASEVAWRG